ncbi:hypothetical protein HPB51_027193 [Rhipicephalus microplus]|uniref:Uncharacterized protein n=1 Tax=Rhipicephalus microplus TaxID=6941 RepID=A0A9J6D0V5_RHIMP|nr:hypothetical protein HPB51_027193 [Rhipicephalus microplus]
MAGPWPKSRNQTLLSVAPSRNGPARDCTRHDQISQAQDSTPNSRFQCRAADGRSCHSGRSRDVVVGDRQAISWSGTFKPGSIFQWCESTAAACTRSSRRLELSSLSSLSMTAYSLHNYAMLKRHAQGLRHYIASRTNMSGLYGNETTAASDAVDPLRRFLKSLGPIAVTPGLKPATPVKNKRTFVVQSINGTLFMIARQKERTTNQNPSARRSAGRQSPPAAGVVASKAPPEAYDILEASVSWNETHSK